MTPEQLAAHHYKLAVIDADSLVYKAAASGTRTYYVVFDDKHISQGEFDKKKSAENFTYADAEILGLDRTGWTIEKHTEDRGIDYALSTFESLLKGIKREVKADKYRLFIGSGELDRASVATLYEYKGNRKGVEKPEHFDRLKQIVMARNDVTVIKQVEVDDAVSVMGYNAYKKNPSQPDTVVCAIDKDLRNTASVIYNYSDGVWELIDEDSANFNFAVQMLAGDKSTDNIMGLPNLTDELYKSMELPKRSGIGKVTAAKLLEGWQCKSLQELYEYVLTFYQAWYGDSYTYKSWRGDELTKTAEEILDENCELLFMERKKGQRWLDYKKENFK